MKLVGRYKARRQRKANERRLAERERQKQLAGQDTERAARDASVGAGAAGQGAFNHW